MSYIRPFVFGGTMISRVILILSVFMSTYAFAAEDFQCAPVTGIKPEITSVATETLHNGKVTLHLFLNDTSGAKVQKNLSAERSVDQGAIFFTTDESILVVDPKDKDPQSGGLRSMYMLPATQEQIPMICQSLI